MILTDQKAADHSALLGQDRQPLQTTPNKSVTPRRSARKPAQETPVRTPIAQRRKQSKIPILQSRKPSQTPACSTMMSDGSAQNSLSNSPDGNVNM